MTRYYALAKNRFSKLPVLNQLLQKKKPLEPQKGYNVVEVYADVYKEEKVSLMNPVIYNNGDYYDYTNAPAVYTGIYLYNYIAFDAADATKMYQPYAVFTNVYDPSSGVWTAKQIVDTLNEYWGGLFVFDVQDGVPYLKKHTFKNETFDNLGGEGCLISTYN